MKPWAIEMVNVTKTFGTVVANEDIILQVAPQEVHVLLGENGAGKSTLMNVLFGLYQPDKGTIKINGQKVEIENPSKALRLGLGMVHQHFMLVERLSVLENIILGNEPGNTFLDYRQSRAKVQEIVDKFNFKLNLDAPVEDLPVGTKQIVEIIKTLYRGADFIIMDEPTAVLTPPEVKDLIHILNELKKHGKTIIFITHKLNETMEIGDRITVLRNGLNVRTLRKEDTNPGELARLMVGRDVNFSLSKPQINVGPKVLSMEQVQLLEQKDKKIDLDVYAGEIVAIAGVEGNGQMELEEILTGLKPCKQGRVVLKGKDVTKLNVQERKLLGLAHIPSDRHKRAMLANFSIEENIFLGRQFRSEWIQYGVVLNKKLNSLAKDLIKSFRIKASDSKQAMKNLSGGNQQKVILAREVSADPELVLAAQPTRGLDIGAIEYIHGLLLELRNQGKGVLLISADLQEIMKLSDRIAVMYEGEIRQVRKTEDFTQEEIGLLMAGREVV